MQYAESGFSIVYLLIALSAGIAILQRRSDSVGKLMGWATLILWFGDCFHLIPRIMRDLAGLDTGLWIEIGTLITSISMTVFYVLLFILWEKLYNEKHGFYAEMLVRDLSGIRALVCVALLLAILFGSSVSELGDLAVLIASLVRNVPFVIVGAIVAVCYYKKRAVIPTLQPIWLLILLSFLFYLPVALGAAYLPILGVLMLPKTVCYILMILRFVRFAGETGAEADS